MDLWKAECDCNVIEKISVICEGVGIGAKRRNDESPSKEIACGLGKRQVRSPLLVNYLFFPKATAVPGWGRSASSTGSATSSRCHSFRARAASTPTSRASTRPCRLPATTPKRLPVCRRESRTWSAC